MWSSHPDPEGVALLHCRVAPSRREVTGFDPFRVGRCWGAFSGGVARGYGVSTLSRLKAIAQTQALAPPPASGKISDFPWSVDICDEGRRPLCENAGCHREFSALNVVEWSCKGDSIPLPSPPWGRGWTATRAFTSGGGPGEGVRAVTLKPRSIFNHNPAMACSCSTGI